MQISYNFMYDEPITPANVLKFGNTLLSKRVMTFNYDMTTEWAYAASYEESYSPWFAYCSKDNCFYEPAGYNWEKKRWNFVKVEGLTTLKEASEYFSVGQAIIDHTDATASADERAELRNAWHILHDRIRQERDKKQEK